MQHMSLMILGTASHVGKSIITAGICRLLTDRGIMTAPFKSQNMSLNSYITKEGDEIGIAQAVQAFAARTEPSCLMNPILLKPKADGVSQVILMGKPWKDIHIKDYYQDTPALLEKAVAAYHELSGMCEAVVIEGAGGAAEVNLYDRDIANIQLARRLKLPIILVADIERGGVFAQIYGTLALLPDDIRPQVKGIIINKFRGDSGLFDSGRKIIEEISGVPVLGVVPWVRLEIPDEDSLSLADKAPTDAPIKIAVIRYGHIANFTDFSLLERAASVAYVPPGTPLNTFDAVILPGTKNTVDDLIELKKSGGDKDIIAAISAGKPVIGICGGYQMLGETLFDNAVEGTEVAEYQGLSVLPVRTEFTSRKKITRRETRTPCPVGPILAKMGVVEGYEIHAGVSHVRGAEAFAGDGSVLPDGLVFGTYLHGLFANSGAVNALCGWIAEQKGISYTPIQPDDDPYEKLAEHLCGCLDVKRIEEIALAE